MKRFAILLMAMVFLSSSMYAQKDEIAQLLLNYEKLAQLKSILSNMKKGYDIVSKGYTKIKNITEGNFDLHKTFLDGLMAVSPAVRNYRHVADILDYQLKIVKEYKSAYRRFQQDSNFTPEEIDYIASVYSNLLDKSKKSLDGLLMVITADKLRMSDDERLQAIDRIFGNIEEQLTFLRQFNNRTQLLALQRAKERNELRRMQKIYGVNN